MLILARRENEKVMFPGLGISIEVVQAGANRVRLGIDAPREVRVIRAELSHDIYPDQPLADLDLDEDSVRSGLQSANLAIQLAKNQLRQGLSERAEEALDQAFEYLQQIESKICSGDAKQTHNFVREHSMPYAFRQPRQNTLRDLIVQNIQFD